MFQLSDLVDYIAYSSDLGGCRTSCFSVLERGQPDLPADGLRDLLGHLVRPAQPQEVEKTDQEYRKSAEIFHEKVLF